MADLSYAFDGNTQGTPDAARKRQAVAQAMMGGGQQMPQDIGQGMQALGQALMQRQQMHAAAFPPPPAPMPGQQPPSFMSGLLSKFGFNNGGGGLS